MSIPDPAATTDVQAIALLGDPTRRKLYDWVSAQARPVGREEAARAVGIARPLATFHLDRLVTGGLLDAGYKRLSGRSGPGAGRPARVYTRAQRDFAVSLPARSYELAADVFADALTRLSADAPPAELVESAHAAGRRVAASALAGKSQRGAPGRKLLSVLTTAGYEPELDATGTIRLRNCPFDALVASHRPLVCGTNLAMGQGIVEGARAEAWQPLADPQPGYCCVAFATAPRADAAVDESPSP
jgi:predicted ArsR family transcriptional regulator